jgi:hypothetical protein
MAIIKYCKQHSGISRRAKDINFEIIKPVTVPNHVVVSQNDSLGTITVM